jgi:hypothetical protein
VHAEFEDVGARVDALETEARIAESHVFEGDAPEALRVADAAIAHARALGGVTAQSAMLHRIRGYALLQLGQVAAARKALDESLEAARQRNEDYEIALSLRGLADLASLTDAEVPEEFVSESSAIFRRLGIVSAPEVPLSAIVAAATP